MPGGNPGSAPFLLGPQPRARGRRVFTMEKPASTHQNRANASFPTGRLSRNGWTAHLFLLPVAVPQGVSPCLFHRLRLPLAAGGWTHRRKGNPPRRHLPGGTPGTMGPRRLLVHPHPLLGRRGERFPPFPLRGRIGAVPSSFFRRRARLVPGLALGLLPVAGFGGPG